MVWYGMVSHGMAWYGMVWYGMVRYGMVWYCMAWHGMVWGLEHADFPLPTSHCSHNPHRETAFQFPAQTIPVFFFKVLFDRPGWNVSKLANLSTEYFPSGRPAICCFLIFPIEWLHFGSSGPSPNQIVRCCRKSKNS